MAASASTICCRAVCSRRWWQCCLAEGLASGQRLAADASIIQADANRQNATPKSDWQADRVDPDPDLGLSGSIWETLPTTAAFGALEPSRSQVHVAIRSRLTTGARGCTCSFRHPHSIIRSIPDGKCGSHPVDPTGRGRIGADNDRPDWVRTAPERLIADTAYGTGVMLDWLDWSAASHPTSLCSTSQAVRTGLLSVPTSPMMPNVTPTLHMQSSKVAGPSLKPRW